MSTAHALQIAGLAPMSSVDWPGKLVATVFTQGCPWACSYCHNHQIIDPRLPGVVSWQAVADLMERRKGLLDGLVFSGGEATRQHALLPAMREVRAWGFEVGLHTAGPYPQRLAQILSEGLADWVGLDIKALPGPDYELLTGRPQAGIKAWESLGVLLASPPPDYEVRLTIDEAAAPTALSIAQRCYEAGARHFALQEVRRQGAPEAYKQAHDGETLRGGLVEAAAHEIRAMGFDTFTFRGAYGQKPARSCEEHEKSSRFVL